MRVIQKNHCPCS